MQEKNMGHICPIGRSGVKLEKMTVHRYVILTIFDSTHVIPYGIFNVRTIVYIYALYTPE